MKTSEVLDLAKIALRFHPDQIGDLLDGELFICQAIDELRNEGLVSEEEQLLAERVIRDKLAGYSYLVDLYRELYDIDIPYKMVAREDKKYHKFRDEWLDSLIEELKRRGN
jgi:hypothetical protein